MKLGIKFYYIFLLTICFFFLSVSTPIGALSLDRLFGGLSFGLLFLSVKSRFSFFTFSIFIFSVYIVFNKLFFQLELVSKSVLMIFSMIVLYTSYQIGLLKINVSRYLNISFIILLLFSIYSIRSFFSLGYVPSTFPILDSIPFIQSVNFSHMESVNQSYLFPRLSLPFPTPPQLSIVCAVFALYFLDRIYSKQSKSYYILFICSVIILILTISRSGILAFLISSFIYFNLKSSKSFFKKYSLFFVSVAFISVFILFFNEDLLNILFSRVDSTLQFSEGEHYKIRLAALNLFSAGDMRSIIFGLGIGNFPGIHSHMSILTILVETGLIGATLYSLIFFNRVYSCIRFCFLYPNNCKNHFYELINLLLVILGMAFYEFTYVIPLYVFLGLAAGYSENEKIKSLYG